MLCFNKLEIRNHQQISHITLSVKYFLNTNNINQETIYINKLELDTARKSQRN